MIIFKNKKTNKTKNIKNLHLLCLLHWQAGPLPPGKSPHSVPSSFNQERMSKKKKKRMSTPGLYNNSLNSLHAADHLVGKISFQDHVQPNTVGPFPVYRRDWIWWALNPLPALTSWDSFFWWPTLIMVTSFVGTVTVRSMCQLGQAIAQLSKHWSMCHLRGIL